jgi:hypothetical protein
MQKWRRRLLALFLAAPMGLGCATIFSSGTQSVTFNSEPAGATYQYGAYSGKTPATIEASRADLAHVATFSLPGYQNATVPVETGVQGVTWVDVLFWPGFIVDFMTGNAYKVNTPVLTATLTPINAPAASAPATTTPAAAPAARSAVAADKSS